MDTALTTSRAQVLRKRCPHTSQSGLPLQFAHIFNGIQDLEFLRRVLGQHMLEIRSTQHFRERQHLGKTGSGCASGAKVRAVEALLKQRGEHASHVALVVDREEEHALGVERLLRRRFRCRRSIPLGAAFNTAQRVSAVNVESRGVFEVVHLVRTRRPEGVLEPLFHDRLQNSREVDGLIVALGAALVLQPCGSECGCESCVRALVVALKPQLA